MLRYPVYTNSFYFEVCSKPVKMSDDRFSKKRRIDALREARGSGSDAEKLSASATLLNQVMREMQMLEERVSIDEPVPSTSRGGPSPLETMMPYAAYFGDGNDADFNAAESSGEEQDDDLAPGQMPNGDGEDDSGSDVSYRFSLSKELNIFF